MAGVDYYSCDACGPKTFYDADLQYHENENPVTHHPWPDGVGEMLVLCPSCAKDNKIIIINRRWL